MKIFISILLFFITSAYVLPVMEIINNSNDICVADMEDGKEDGDKKEKTKEFFLPIATDICIKNLGPRWHQHTTLNSPMPHHTIESPPPDNNG